MDETTIASNEDGPIFIRAKRLHLPRLISFDDVDGTVKVLDLAVLYRSFEAARTIRLSAASDHESDQR